MFSKYWKNWGTSIGTENPSHLASHPLSSSFYCLLTPFPVFQQGLQVGFPGTNCGCIFLGISLALSVLFPLSCSAKCRRESLGSGPALFEPRSCPVLLQLVLYPLCHCLSSAFRSPSPNVSTMQAAPMLLGESKDTQ